ncbi:MAG TPA: CoA transferase [Bordetella sp.]|jgi:crotonobetainyl-CoA:carnitine CoA-transferase CaiB-like acyl-CoA transferase|nr:CoA transferase [Bordetella sp.]
MFRNILTDVTVVDFTQLGAGPMCTMLLGDMGANVIKVESPQGELGRMLGPGWIGEDCTAYYGFNRNKRSISIDLKTARGKDLAHRLIGTADVVVESMRPGAMQRLGLDYESVRRTHEKVVYCSISAYGQSGPYADRPGVDGILQADCGLMSIIGTRDSAEPCKVQAPVVDVTTGCLAALGVVAQLLDLHRQGNGGYIDISLMNAALTLQQTSLTNYLHERVVPERVGSAAPYSAPNEAFQTQDGWIMVAAYNGTRWQDLCNVLGLPALAHDARFVSSSERVRNREAMRAELTRAFVLHPTAHWLERLTQADILCARVSDYSDLARHPQAAHNRMFTHFTHPLHGAIGTVGFPINSAQENREPHGLPPGCGEHTREILGELRLDPEEIGALCDARVVFEPASR